VTPEFLYERRWALDLLQRVEERLAGGWLAADKQELFRYLRPTLTREPDAVPHAEIARHLRTTLSTVQNAARRLRQRFRALLRQELREHVADPAALDEEERYLFEILARGGGRHGDGDGAGSLPALAGTRQPTPSDAGRSLRRRARVRLSQHAAPFDPLRWRPAPLA
ncbi:MAG TPA: hypothetical protein PKD86_15125, partial [Gemmatales bacterium]|nr:hypothetical protein [Gemmatales bacterium]